jgi:peptide-methionine (S)-S-oxide reductase
MNDKFSKTETATLAGGCFWCLHAAYKEVEGVVRVVSGYSGGRRENPSYEQVCTGSTGHAEVVQVEFDAGTLDFEDVLDIFFALHDPTTLNRQGADVGTQYRSAVFYHNEEQKRAAEQKISELEQAKIWNNPIVTVLEPLDVFYPAEEYHQDYFARNPGNPYCQAVINPKLSKLRQKFSARLKA